MCVGKVTDVGLFVEMDISILRDSPEIVPLLVRLHDREKLLGLADRPAQEARSELTGIVADLLSFELQPREMELVSDVLISLLRQAERDLRAALAERLSAMESVPLRMILHLANDEIMVADPVLRKSPALYDMDLIYLIKSHGSEHWQSIARRETLGEAVIDALVDTGDLQTEIALSENKSITLTQHAINILVEMAKESDSLAKPLLQRKDLPAEVTAKLYQYAGEEIKRYIIQNRHGAGIKAVDDIVLELSRATVSDFTPSAQMIEAAENMIRRDLLRPDIMIENLKRGQIASFIAQFSAYTSLPLATVQDMVKQESGQGLAIACKAAGIVKPDFTNIFLLTHKARAGGERTVNQYGLMQALRYYDRLSEQAAQELLKQGRN